jgi:GDP-L-fucose synthase
MKSVIVTGGTGFIGSALATRLCQRSAPVEKIFAPGSADVDFVNREESFKWFERIHRIHEVTHIFHLAAVYKAGGWPEAHPGTQFQANMQINLNVLEGWRLYFPKARFTSVVSYCMYPDHDKPHPESELWGTEPEPYLFAYAFTKKALLIGQRAYCREFGLEASSLVLPTVYGPRGGFSEMSHVIGALIGKFVRAVERGEDSVEVWGDGSQEREFIHVNDVVDALLLVADRPVGSSVLNLGTSQSTSIHQLVDIIKEYVGFDGRVVFNADRFVGAVKRVLDSRKIADETGWQAKVPLKQGIKEVVDWYRSTLVENPTAGHNGTDFPCR